MPLTGALLVLLVASASPGLVLPSLGFLTAASVVLQSKTVLLNITVSPEATFVAALALRHPDASPIGCDASSFTTNLLGPSLGWTMTYPSGWGAQQGVSNTGVGFELDATSEPHDASVEERQQPSSGVLLAGCDLAGDWRGSKGPPHISITQTGTGEFLATGTGVSYHMKTNGSTVSLGNGITGQVERWNASSPPCSYINGSTGWWWCRRSACGKGPPIPPPPPPPPPAPPKDYTGWYSAKGGVVSVVEAGRHVKISGIKLLGSNAPEPDAVATEDWTLKVEDSTFRWTVNRTWLRTGVVNSDRTPALVLQPSFLPTPSSGGDSCGGDGPKDLCTETQMATFVDETMMLDTAHDSGFALPARSGGPSRGNSPQQPGAVFTEAISRRRQQWVELVPSGLALNITTTNPHSTFNFGKAGIVGTPLSFGGSLVDRAARSAVNVSAGEIQTNTLVVEIGRAVGTAPLSLSIPAVPELPQIAAHFGRTHNVLFGSIFGNSPTSITALQEMSVFPMIQSAFNRRQGTDIDAALAAQIQYFGQHALNASGYLYSRWDIMGDEQDSTITPKDSQTMFGCLLDQLPHYILANYHQVINTGDLGFLKEQMRSIDAAAGFLLHAMQMQTEGVPINRCTSGKGTKLGGGRPSNWHDTIAFGHHDGLVAVLAVHAFGALAEMKLQLGDTAGAAAAAQTAEKGVAAYSRVYWSEEHGVFSDWVDSSGRRRDYFFTWQNLIAVTSEVANSSQSASIMSALRSERARLAQAYNVTPADLWCTPSNTRPVAPDDVFYCNSGSPYPFYLNGDCFLLMSGWEMLALGKAGESDNAFEMLSHVLAQYQRNLLWGQRYSWQHSEMHGNDILANTLVALTMGLQASFGISTNLTGIGVISPPARKLEGARWCFHHRGKEACVSVKGGKQRILYTAAIAAQ